MKRINRGDDRPGREAGIDEPGVRRPADDVEHPQGELHLAGHQRFRRIQLPAHGKELGQAAFGITHQLPGQSQERALVGGDGERPRLGGIQQRFDQRRILRRGKDRVVKPLAPPLEVLLHAFRTDDRTAVGQVHVIFEIPAEVFVIGLGQERREGRGNAHNVPRRVLEAHGE
jgi:hypothetical protein